MHQMARVGAKLALLFGYVNGTNPDAQNVSEVQAYLTNKTNTKTYEWDPDATTPVMVGDGGGGGGRAGSYGII